MNQVIDSKGNEIKVGSVVKVKGSKVVRRVQPGMHGSNDLHVSSNGAILAVRIDGGSMAWSAWVLPAKLEVVA